MQQYTSVHEENTVKPGLTATSPQRPPGSNGQIVSKYVTLRCFSCFTCVEWSNLLNAGNGHRHFQLMATNAWSNVKNFDQQKKKSKRMSIH